MDRHVAFLRGVNLGKSRRVANEQLRAAFEGAGLEGVATFRASGNVVFDAARGAAALDRRIEDALAAALGFEVRVFLRSARQVREIAAHEPFEARRVEASKGKLQVAVLPAAPGSGAGKKALALAGKDDLLALRGGELYWLPSGGTLETGLDLTALEALVGPWTMRTKGTIELIASKHCGA